METPDRLDQKWRQLKEEIKSKESELEELRRKFKILDDARAILVAMTPASEAAAAKLSEAIPSSPPRGLQEAVLEYVRHAPGENGVNVGQTANALREEFESRYSNRNSYNASVFVSMKRLTEQGKVRVLHGGLVRRYAPADGSRSLFLARREIVAGKES